MSQKRQRSAKEKAQSWISRIAPNGPRLKSITLTPNLLTLMLHIPHKYARLNSKGNYSITKKAPFLTCNEPFPFCPSITRFLSNTLQIVRTEMEIYLFRR